MLKIGGGPVTGRYSQMTTTAVRHRITVEGIVQSVGFRPFVHRLARELALSGSIYNFTGGVVIEVEGAPEAVDRFVERLQAERPPIALIDSIDRQPVATTGDTEFHIIPSRPQPGAPVLVSPDVATCAACERELLDPEDRRYLHPFINCTNCGPRFTIISALPYDRPQTTMAPFPMCERCRAEYESIDDRRYHAQPVACPDFGPTLELRAADSAARGLAALDAAVKLLAEGKIVAVKGLGGFHLACDALQNEAVVRLRDRKRREEKPLAIMCPDLETIRRFCEVSSEAEELLGSPQRPIVLLPKTSGDCTAPSVAPDSRYHGVMLPYTPVHRLLFERGDFSALVMTSGNLTDEPLAIDNDEAGRRLGDIADAFLLHDREILVGCDDSVIRPSSAGRIVMRRSRGFVPFPVRVREEQPCVLAVGGHLKNTFCLTRGRYAFLSQHIGDLEDAGTLDYFERCVAHFEQLLEAAPIAVAYDLHPDYLSTRYALAEATRRDLPALGVQHHHAHAASCLAENGVEGPTVAVVCDGLGFGSDGTLWGCEILVADLRDFTRRGHLAYMPLPGGAQAIKQPWRMAAAYADRALGSDADHVDVIARHRAEWQVLRAAVERGVNCPPISSAGRLFDAVSALCGLGDVAAYEAQPAIRLEAAARPAEGLYEFELHSRDGVWELDPLGIIRGVVTDLGSEAPVGEVAGRFHGSFVALLAEAAQRVAEEENLDRVALSGGTFQNDLVLSRLREALEQRGLKVLVHHHVPCNDGGLSLGQAIVAAGRV